jgi:hypothetical protein
VVVNVYLIVIREQLAILDSRPSDIVNSSISGWFYLDGHELKRPGATRPYET